MTAATEQQGSNGATRKHVLKAFLSSHIIGSHFLLLTQTLSGLFDNVYSYVDRVVKHPME